MMSNAVAFYRARVTGGDVHELRADGQIGLDKAKEWCRSLSLENSTVDLYCLRMDGSEIFYETIRPEGEDVLSLLDL